MADNKKIDMIKRFIGEENLTNIEKYIESVRNRLFTSFQTDTELKIALDPYINELSKNSELEEIEAIRYYTGISFSGINSLLRNNWSYENSGALTDEKRKNLYDSIEKLNTAFSHLGQIGLNFKTYRGANISSFKDYNISSIGELSSLIGEYYFDSGFTSTSLLKKASFYNKDLEWHDKCNIEMEYLVPEEFNSGIPLINFSLSYSPSQNEFLIDKGSLAKIVDVIVDKDCKSAHIKLLLIPKKVWDYFYRQNIEYKTK